MSKTYYCVAHGSRLLSCSLDEEKAIWHLRQLQYRSIPNVGIVERTARPRGVKAPPRPRGPTQGSLFAKKAPGGRQGSLFDLSTEKLRVQIRRDGASLIADVRGKAGRIKVRGESLPFHPAFEELSPGMLTRLTWGRINRADGTGRRIPEATRRAIESAVEAALISAGASVRR